jgi:hypothetical protein
VIASSTRTTNEPKSDQGMCSSGLHLLDAADFSSHSDLSVQSFLEGFVGNGFFVGLLDRRIHDFGQVWLIVGPAFCDDFVDSIVFSEETSADG